SPASISAYGTHFGDTITLDSYWSWQYFTGHSAHDTPGSGAPRFRFDEMHFRLAAPLKANDVIKFEKIEGGDEMGLDFIEIETVPAPIPKPTAGYVFDLSDPKYGGVTSNVGDNGADNIAKLNTLMEDARNRAKTNPNEVTVWIPEGKWNLGRGWALGAQNMKIMGAGMWYTNLHFTSSLDWNGGISGEINKNNRCDNFWDPKPQNGQNLHSTNLDFGHMYLSSMLRSRYGEEAVYKCFMDSFGSNSRIHNIWEEHFECGFWIADYNGNIVQTDYLTIEDSRLRNNLADAVNFCRGTQYSTVKNCSVRGNGDDALAMWNDSSQRDQVGNAFLNNTIENNWRAAAIGIFGGDAHRIENNYIKDCFKSAAIRVNTTFPGFKFNNTNNISFKNNTIISSGTSHNCYDYVQGAIDFEGGGVKNITFENTDIYNSQRYAVRFFRQHSNITFTNTTVDTIWADGDMHKGTGEQPCNVNELSPGCKVVFSHENQTNIVFNGLAVKNVQGNPRLAALKDEYKTINNVPSASDDFLRNTSNGFTLNNVTWPSGTAVPETTALSLGPVNFGIMDMGYAAPPAQRTVSIRNTGSGAAAIAQVSVSNTGAFAVTALDATAIASCAVNTSLKIQPKPGLPAGKHTATITVLYNNGRVSTAEVKFIVEGVNPPSAPTITTSSLADGVKGAAYSASLAATASGGGQITWSISGANTLTAYGLALNPNGAISGTPTAAGLVTFSVVATNDIGASAPKQLTINIIDPALQPPVVLSVTPAGAGAPVNGQIAITFSKPMDPAAGTVRLNALPALTGGVWSGNTVFTIPYSGLANSTVYTVNISGFKDTAGQAMTPNSTHGFTTAETNPNNRTAPGTIFASTYDETNGARLDIQNCSDLPGNG
ncbi:MAG: Ig-like domain-containing protein, partial [Oscillospiraceae bacterium]|nr:Ig-like domain-containing protein [Oscillospiraceae bacterium]